MNTTTTVQTPAELRSTQAVWPQWMAKACGTATQVKVTRRVTPFGSFVVAVEAVR